MLNRINVLSRRFFENKPLQNQYTLMIGLIFLSCILRLVWMEDMEWKADEIWMFEKVRSVLTGQEPLPMLGMPSSAKIANPGASVWVFLILGLLTADPVAMTQWVAGINMIGIVLFFGFFQQVIPLPQRLTWLWGLTLASVNPMMILFSRKLWTTNILSPLCFLIFVGHWFRNKNWGAFLWGLLGTLIGQIHMSGFFFQAGLFLWTVWKEWRSKRLQTAWKAWIIGSLLGIFPMIPWMQMVLLKFGTAGGVVKRAGFPEFYLQWLLMGWGLNLEHNMSPVFLPFLAEPHVLGNPTFLMAILHLFLAICGLFPIFGWIFSSRYRTYIRGQDFDNLIFYLKAIAIGMGGLTIIPLLQIPVYYLNILFPFIHIWIAFLYRKQPKLLILIAIVQLFISLTFILYVHQHGGIPNGNYGVSYRLQNYQTQP